MENYEKKYKEALEKLQEALAPKDGCEISGLTRGCIEEIFPELKESEDEKIKRNIIAALKGEGYYDCDLTNECIAWLEKQGEKAQGKTALEAIQEEKIDNKNCATDKVEPKFKVGDWIVWQDKCCKVNYNGCGYELVDQNGLSTSLEYGTVDENAHIWDIIKDAEDGNVLVSDNIIFIFNRIHDIWIKCRCSLYEDGSFYGGDFDLMHVHYGKEVFPATKEQCDKLLKAMTNAGYIFDFEKKELKKIEPKFKVKYAGSKYDVIEIKEFPGGITYYGIEDEPNHIDYILPENCEIISGYGVKEKGNSYPTKSTIFSQQNPVWSEEDDYNVQCLAAKVTSDIQNGNVGRNQKLIDWLKSLKERCTWKPSNIQMECLHDAVEHYHTNGYPASKLNELYEQMSKIYKL